MEKNMQSITDFLRVLSNDFKRIQSEIKIKHNIEVNIPDEYLLKTICEYLMEIKDYDESLYIHSISVCIWSGHIGKLLGLNSIEMNELYIASALHDIGKLLIPEDIIKKVNKLDDTEKRIIETHPSFGVYFINYKKMMMWPVSANRKIMNIIEQHHEELNGQGYPNSLAGYQIGTGARIVAIADKFEAYGAKRVYHGERTVEETIDFLKRQAAEGVIDKDILSEFINSLQEKG